jgi:hypothetical protein
MVFYFMVAIKNYGAILGPCYRMAGLFYGCVIVQWCYFMVVLSYGVYILWLCFRKTVLYYGGTIVLRL